MTINWIAAARNTITLALLAASLAGAQAPSSPPPTGSQDDLPTITYRRVFKGSRPEFVEIIVRQDGAAKSDIRQLDEPPEPQEFQLGAPVRARIFELAAQLKFFKGLDLDVHRKIAFLGQKTFRWQNGTQAYETQFNYTLDAKAAQLQNLFENITEQQAQLAALEQALRYDRLGVNDALLSFENDLNQRLIPEPEKFLPLLDRMAQEDKLIEIARQRARSLAARIRAGRGQ